MMLRRFLKDKKGSAAVEFALVLPLLLLLSFGGINIGLLFIAKNQLNTVLNAGILYAVGVSSNTSSIQSAMSNATTFPGLTSSVVSFCECLDGTILTCGSSQKCADTTSPGQYVKLTGTAPVTLFYSQVINLQSPYSITANITIRTG